MTDYEFKQACAIQKRLSDYNEKLRQIERMIERLKELTMHSSASDIHIKLNEQWMATPVASIDYSDLLDFLTKQRDRINREIKADEEGFAKL